MPITSTNELVILKCNKCGEEICFYPHTVVHVSGCNCGNDNYGSPSQDWPINQFGDFTMLERYMETLSIPYPWEENTKRRVD